MGWVTQRQEAVATVCQWQMISKMCISRDKILATLQNMTGLLVMYWQR